MRNFYSLEFKTSLLREIFEDWLIAEKVRLSSIRVFCNERSKSLNLSKELWEDEEEDMTRLLRDLLEVSRDFERIDLSINATPAMAEKTLGFLMRKKKIE